MPDPFEVLRAPLTPVDPEQGFAARLRARIERALDLPKGVTVSDLAIEDRPTPAVRTATVTPYIAVAGAPAALEWYAEAFGARRLGEPIVMPDGRIGHAEIDISGATIMLSEEHPEIGVSAPATGHGVPVTLVPRSPTSTARWSGGGRRSRRSNARPRTTSTDETASSATPSATAGWSLARSLQDACATATSARFPQPACATATSARSPQHAAPRRHRLRLALGPRRREGRRVLRDRARLALRAGERAAGPPRRRARPAPRAVGGRGAQHAVLLLRRRRRRRSRRERPQSRGHGRGAPLESRTA